MRIIFDYDGVLTDFNRFIRENAISYFQKKYHMKVMKPDALEIEDIFGFQNVSESFGYSIQEADNIKKQVLNRFWISHRFIKFSLLNRFSARGQRIYKLLEEAGVYYRNSYLPFKDI